jgi:hypothetical protein
VGGVAVAVAIGTQAADGELPEHLMTEEDKAAQAAPAPAATTGATAASGSPDPNDPCKNANPNKSDNYQYKGSLPKAPNGMTNGQLGELFDWGRTITTGYEDAVRRVGTLTANDITRFREAGITSDYARALADGYCNAPQPNPTAPGRARLMYEIARRLEE